MITFPATLTASAQSIGTLAAAALTSLPATYRAEAVTVIADSSNAEAVKLIGAYGSVSAGEHIGILAGEERSFPVSSVEDASLAGLGLKVEVIIHQI